MSRGTVLLYNPKTRKEEGPSQWTPLALLSLASALEEKGYEAVIIDEKMENAAHQKALDVAAKALCLGITSMTGGQIRNGIVVAQRVREVVPALPIIWGGWHPSLCPETTTASPYADIVVRGQGEETLLEIVERLGANRSLDGVLGASYKRDGEVIHNPPRPFKDLSCFKRPAYHILDLTDYQKAPALDVIPGDLPDFFGKVKAINYIASHGCPFKCAFCSVYQIHRQRHHRLPPSRVVEDLQYLAEQGFNTLNFEDNLFFLDQKWVGAICEGLIASGLNLRWYAAGRAPDICRFSDDTLETIARSGCKYIFIGAESGSQEVLDIVDKKANVSDTVEVVAKLHRYGITTCLTYMVGVPGEPPGSYWDTLRQIAEIKTIHEETVTNIACYTPYPGTPLFERAKAMGFQAPTTLEGWAEFMPSLAHSLFISQSTLYRLRVFSDFYMRYAFPSDSLKERMQNSLPLTVLHHLALWRFKRRMLSFMWEFWLARALKRLHIL